MNKYKLWILIAFLLLGSSLAKGQISLKPLYYCLTGLDGLHFKRIIVPELLWVDHKEDKKYQIRLGFLFVPLKTRADTFLNVLSLHGRLDPVNEIYSKAHYVLFSTGLDYLFNPDDKFIIYSGFDFLFGVKEYNYKIANRPKNSEVNVSIGALGGRLRIGGCHSISDKFTVGFEAQASLGIMFDEYSFGSYDLGILLKYNLDNK